MVHIVAWRVTPRASQLCSRGLATVTVSLLRYVSFHFTVIGVVLCHCKYTLDEPSPGGAYMGDIPPELAPVGALGYLMTG